jgi:hypothetical protein
MTNRPARIRIQWHDQLTLLLIAAVLVRLALIVPRWVTGTPPAYPGQYEGRLLVTITMVGILGAALLAKRPVFHTSRGKIAYWGLLGVAIVAMVVDASVRP